MRNIQCYTYTKYGRYGKCFSHYANYEDLEMDILHFLNQLGKNFLKDYDAKALLSKCEQIINENLANLKKELQTIEKQLQQEKKISKQLYLDKIEGIISDKQYMILGKDCDETITRLESDYERITNEIDQINNSNELLTIQEIEQMMKAFFEYKTQSNELLSKVIDKIVIDKRKM